MDHLRTGVRVNNNQQAVVCAHYYSEIAELVVCVREIALQWEHHVDEHTLRDMAASYSAGYAHVGRLRFNITRFLDASEVVQTEALDLLYSLLHSRPIHTLHASDRV